MPGQHPRSVTLTLGYGHQEINPIADGAGFDFYRIRTQGSMGFAADATLERISGRYELASTQDHHAIGEVGDRGIQKRLPTLFREATLEHYESHPDFAAHELHVVHRLNVWGTDLMKGADYRWAMAIDLTACTGCSACVVACQAENNIPIVGKDQIIRGRELHWIRVDRYFKGTDPQWPEAVALQPVNCMMCENAPCEQVCPVAATTHDRDGLNVMVYNRCIGTRYCSNNCPYKVRRFNYFDYQVREPVRDTGALHVQGTYYTRPQSDADPLRRMMHNPEVTVRSRGVMEKCTYCVQRLTKAKIKAKNEHVQTEKTARSPRVTVPDSDIAPACAQACPADAIFLGDLSNPASGIRPLHRHPRAYEMLEEINTKARTKYLAKLRNPSPNLTPHHEPGPDEGEHRG
jgi:molybdopterin-containing oxidoreductase family iron-sulfur binding subunit